MPVILTDEQKKRVFDFVSIDKGYHDEFLRISRVGGWPPKTLEEMQRDNIVCNTTLKKLIRCKPGCAIMIKDWPHQHSRLYARSVEPHWNPEIAALQAEEIELTAENNELLNQINNIIRELKSKQGKVYRKLKKTRENILSQLAKKENTFADVFHGYWD